MRDTFVSWQKILASGFSSGLELLDFLDLPADLFSHAAERSFKTRVPRGFALRMEPKNPRDPLLLQVLAAPAELSNDLAYAPDPLQEKKVNPVPGLLHKYTGRVLLTLSGVCAINCRYCFRRHFPYETNNPGRQGWAQALSYISKDSSIHEVIFSGGDPLLISDTVMADILQQLELIKHVKIVRFHTRIPVVLPERINESLRSILNKTTLKKVVVLHCNHPQEINASVKEACQALREAGCHLLNQSVILKDINNKASILAELSFRLLDCDVIPYYLHVLDKVAGAQHFDMPLQECQAIYKALQLLVPGYLLPRLVREDAGEGSKTLLAF